MGTEPTERRPERACPRCGAALQVSAPAAPQRLVRVDCAACGAIVAVRLDDEPTSAEAKVQLPPKPRAVMATSAAGDDEAIERLLPRRFPWAATLLAVVAAIIAVVLLYSKLAAEGTP